MGLHHAFPDAEIVGVDIRPQPRYPFTFVQGDALEFDLSGFDFVWASPPCQAYSVMQFLPGPKRTHPDLLGPVRARLVTAGVPWIIENVVGAPMAYSAQLCGQMFGLGVYRHRRFEAPFMMMAPGHQKHTYRIKRLGGPNTTYTSAYKYLKGGSAKHGPVVTVCGNNFALPAGSRAMGIDWMTKAELAESVPPAYSRYLAQFIPIEDSVAA